MDNKKIVIIGDGYVGKTSILRAMRHEDFEEQIPNVQDEFEFDEIVNNKKYKIKLVDTAGQEEYSHLRKMNYKEADACIICFAIDNPISFENISTKWLKDIDKNIPIILVGTKLDLRKTNLNHITKEMAKKFQKKIAALYYIECSSKSGQGINELRTSAIRTLFHQKMKKSCEIL